MINKRALASNSWGPPTVQLVCTSHMPPEDKLLYIHVLAIRITTPAGGAVAPWAIARGAVLDDVVNNADHDPQSGYRDPTMTLQTFDLAPRIGTEIKADRELLLSGKYASQIRGLLEQRGVVIVRQLALDGPQQVALARSLGEVLPQGDNYIMKITLDKNESPGAEYLKGTFYWHIDGATDDVPTRAALLTAKRLSATGGVTEFANTYAAYDDLPQADKDAFSQVRVVHSLEAAQRMVNPEPAYSELQMWQRMQPKTHPLVWKHQSGRKSLVLGATASHVEGMSLDEGRALLCRVLEWTTQPQFVYAHEWQIGDLLIWDNTGVMHRVTPYAFDSGRMMHRTTLVGEEALA
jgi:alpha-ketoglutarate-dependent taurine dioxygenase